MKQFVGVTVALTALMIAPAFAQDRTTDSAAFAPGLTTDPQVQIYRFTGVRDDGGAATAGVATSFHCTNFSGANENLRIQIRNYLGTVAKDITFVLAHNRTFTMSTHATNAFAEDSFLDTGVVNQGSARIWATSTSVICTASTIDAAASVPYGVDLHGIRFNPIPGTEE
jgi:hypothetical protein